MARCQKPTTCTDNNCTHDLHERTHERDSELGIEAHPDAPVFEAVCSIHGVVYSY